MKNFHWCLFGMLVFATYFCFWGQDLAYVLNDHVVSTFPIYYLTGLTTLGISLYLVAALSLVWLFKKKKLTDRNWLVNINLGILLLVAPYASIWAFFVTAMWWG